MSLLRIWESSSWYKDFAKYQHQLNLQQRENPSIYIYIYIYIYNIYICIYINKDIYKNTIKTTLSKVSAIIILLPLEVQKSILLNWISIFWYRTIKLPAMEINWFLFILFMVASMDTEDTQLYLIHLRHL